MCFNLPQVKWNLISSIKAFVLPYHLIISGNKETLGKSQNLRGTQPSASSIKWSNLGHFLKSQGKFFLSFLCALFNIFLSPENYKSSL